MQNNSTVCSPGKEHQQTIIVGDNETVRKPPAATTFEDDGSTNWREVVSGIRMGDRDAVEFLYQELFASLRLRLRAQHGVTDGEDIFHQTFILTINAIQRGDLRQPERLMGFIQTIANRQCISQIRRNVLARQCQANFALASRLPSRTETPEAQLFSQEQIARARAILAEMPPRDREILTRFYVWEQSEEQISNEMGLTANQYRLLKSRAKSRLAKVAGRRQHVRFLPQIRSASA